VHVPTERAPSAAPAVEERVAAPPKKRRTGRIILVIGLVTFLAMCVGAVLLGLWLIGEGEGLDRESTAQALAETQVALVRHTRTVAAREQAALTARAGDQATATVEAQATATAEAVVHATATVEAQVPISALEEAKGWSVMINDSFYDNGNDWAVGDSTGEYADMIWTLGDGIYRWEGYAFRGFIWWVYPSMDDLYDFYVAADLEPISGPANLEQGIMFRHNDDNQYYVFEIDANQEYAVFYYDSAEWYELWPWSYSPALVAGQPNRLAVLGRGDEFLFYINDQLVAEVADSSVLVGKAGLIVGLSNEGDEAIWEFSNFELRVP
jgi:hypothetical protein